VSALTGLGFSGAVVDAVALDLSEDLANGAVSFLDGRGDSADADTVVVGAFLDGRGDSTDADTAAVGAFLDDNLGESSDADTLFFDDDPLLLLLAETPGLVDEPEDDVLCLLVEGAVRDLDDILAVA
jgi:hypothetical protein